MSQLTRSNFGVKVENIDATVSEKNLNDLFDRYGEINSTKIQRNESRAYVNFNNKENAEAAVNGLNDTFIKGKKIKVSLQPWIDFRPITDCLYKSTCAKKDSCPYRHVTTKDEGCKFWIEKRCKNVSCKYAHPSLRSPNVPDSPSSPLTSNFNQTIQPGNSLREKLEKDCECSICHDIIENPRTLACSHSFCKDCLERCEGKFLFFNEESHLVVKCIIGCSQENVLKMETIGTGLSAELQLKKNLELLKRIDQPFVNNSNCSYDSCNGSAEMICNSCGSWICKHCNSAHSDKCKSTNFHRVKYFNKTESLVAYCLKHDCYSHYYCKNCFTPLCIYCKKWEHDNTHEITSIAEFANKFVGPIQNCSKTVDEEKINYEKIKNDLDNSKYAIEVQSHFKKVKFQILSKLLYTFDCVEKQMLEDVTRYSEKLKDENNEKLHKYQAINNDIDSLKDSTSNIEKIIKTRVITEELNSMSRENFRMEPKPSSMTDGSLLKKTISDLISDGIGTVEISFGDRKITPSFEGIFDNHEFDNLNDLDGSKKYCQKAGIFNDKEKRAGKSTKKENKSKKLSATDQNQIIQESVQQLPNNFQSVSIAPTAGYTTTRRNERETKKKNIKNNEEIKEAGDEVKCGILVDLGDDNNIVEHRDNDIDNDEINGDARLDGNHGIKESRGRGGRKGARHPSGFNFNNPSSRGRGGSANRGALRDYPRSMGSNRGDNVNKGQNYRKKPYASSEQLLTPQDFSFYKKFT